MGTNIRMATETSSTQSVQVHSEETSLLEKNHINLEFLSNKIIF